MSAGRLLNPRTGILLGVAVMLSLSMGIRQSMGLIMPALTKDTGLSVAQFTLSISLQNLTWGLLQPFLGALAVRVGFRPVLVGGGLIYSTGLLLLASAQGLASVLIGGGVLMGVGLACTASGMAQAVASRVATAGRRSFILGLITGSGSLGALLSAPLGQYLGANAGWRLEVVAFLVVSLLITPFAWLAGSVDNDEQSVAGTATGASASEALRRARTSTPFLVMIACYSVCGLQLLFITAHLPAYLAICGMDPMLSAEAVGVIGCTNVLGSIFFGWAGGRWSKQALLGGIYTTRSLCLWAYFFFPPSPSSTIVFAAAMGFLWLGVGPLVAGSVIEIFGLKWQAMIQGIAFMSHQLGSFVGAFGGGILFDALGSYDVAWKLIVAMGLTAGLFQIAYALLAPSNAAPTAVIEAKGCRL